MQCLMISVEYFKFKINRCRVYKIMQATEISPYWPHLQVQTFTRTQSTLVNIKEVKFCITT